MELDDRAVVDYLQRNPEFLSVMPVLLKRCEFRTQCGARSL